MLLDLCANRIPIAIRRAIAGKGGRLIVLHEVDHPDGYVRAWTGAGLLNFDGEVWYGLGDLASITNLSFSRKTATRNPVMTLLGVKSEQLQFINSKVRGRLARVSLAALYPNSRLVNGEVYYLCVAKCDYQDHKIGRDRSAMIEIGLIEPIFVMDRAPNTKWTPDWLKATYGDDIVGLDDLPGSAARQESWAPP